MKVLSCCRMWYSLLSLILIFFIGFIEWVMRSSILLILHSTQSTRLDSLNRLAATKKPRIRNDGRQESVWVQQYRVTVSLTPSSHSTIWFNFPHEHQNEEKKKIRKKTGTTLVDSIRRSLTYDNVYTVVWDERRMKRNENTRTQHAVISLFICIIYNVLCMIRDTA